jgi:hypothetical protein
MHPGDFGRSINLKTDSQRIPTANPARPLGIALILVMVGVMGYGLAHMPRFTQFGVYDDAAMVPVEVGPAAAAPIASPQAVPAQSQQPTVVIQAGAGP